MVLFRVHTNIMIRFKWLVFQLESKVVGRRLEDEEVLPIMSRVQMMLESKGNKYPLLNGPEAAA